jgi:hypothetical protein
MSVHRTFFVVLVSLLLAHRAHAQEPVPYDTKPDEPTRIEQGIFYDAVRLQAADGPIDSGPSWGHSSPWVEDVDGDGLRDLVVGDFSGFFRLYRNVGTNAVPRYDAATNIQADGADTKVPIY